MTAGAAPSATQSGDSGLRLIVARQVGPLRAADAAAAGSRGGPAVQLQYDLGRNLAESLRALPPVSQGCRALLAAARLLAAGEIREADGVDRLSPRIAATGRRWESQANAALNRLRLDCTRGAVRTPVVRPELGEPLGGEAFPGFLRVRAPAGTRTVDVLVNGNLVASKPSRTRSVVATIGKTYGRGTVSARFRNGNGVLLGRADSHDVWLLPQTAARHAGPATQDQTLTARLAQLGSGFAGYTGIWVHDLTTGATAAWNEDARFPAASTVKLGVLVAALARFGPRPERSRIGHDLEALTGWSSNLAANKLLRDIGGSEYGGSVVAEQTLRRLGATASSYTGDYRVGTARRAAPDQPPIVSQRVTTAHDLGRVLALLHSAAMGDAAAQRTTGLSRHQARVGLGLLLSWEPTKDNLGLLSPRLGDTPIAQKNGWLHDAEHTAAIVYRKSGPVVVVVLTYRPGIKRVEAARFGAKVLAAALP